MYTIGFSGFADYGFKIKMNKFKMVDPKWQTVLKSIVIIVYKNVHCYVFEVSTKKIMKFNVTDQKLQAVLNNIVFIAIKMCTILFSGAQIMMLISDFITSQSMLCTLN